MNDAIQPNDAYDENPLAVIELSLSKIVTVARLLGHLCGSIEAGRAVMKEELSALQLMLDVAETDIDVHWKMAWEEKRLIEERHAAEIADLESEHKAALAELKAKKAAPGSEADKATVMTF